jgi:hypothetical protein
MFRNYIVNLKIFDLSEIKFTDSTIFLLRVLLLKKAHILNKLRYKLQIRDQVIQFGPLSTEVPIQLPNGQLDRQRKYKEATNKLNQDKEKPRPKG